MATPADLGERSLRRLGVIVVPLANRPVIGAVVSIASIATGALQELGVIASDETPDVLDQQVAEDKARAVHASLVGSSFVFWAESAIPQHVAEDYTKLTAGMLSTTFGKSADPKVIILLEERIKRFAVIAVAPEMATNAIMDVHRGLVATGFANWTSQDIPPAAEEPYVILACVALAPQFGVQFDPRLGVQAQQQLRRIIAIPTSGTAVMAEYF